MKFSDCNIFIDGSFCYGDLETEAGRFSALKIRYQAEVMGRDYIIPGLIDIHTHGSMGYDFSDGRPEAMEPVADYYASHGITGFCPTTMTLPYEVLEKAFGVVRDFAMSQKAAEESGAASSGVTSRVLGINMEGPYFSVKKKGAQNEAYLKAPDFESFRKLYEGCGGMISLVDVAPELEGAGDFAQKASVLCAVSAAHTDADYDQGKAFFEAGADHLTHLFNAMPPVHHREPGVIGAASEKSNVYAELICDGHHIHPGAVRMGFELFKDRICLISDSLRCAGMPDGEYELGGQPVFLKGGVARLAAGNLAGSSTNLFDCMKNAISFGIPAETAIAAATINPARSIRADKEVGSIEAGKRADFIVCDSSLNIREVYIGGRKH